MIVFESADDLRVWVDTMRNEHRRIGFVPTMGNLHDGHLRLLETARERDDKVVCSIFINPMQFGPDEDLDAYPRTPERDRTVLQVAGCHALFLPSVEEVYGESPERHTRIHVPELSENFCGKSRPGHFDGVATVVAKLFNLVRPDDAFFGLKDYQQFLVIRKMVQDLALPVRVFGVETVREASGLAMSSRNSYLSEEQRRRAASLFQTLRLCSESIEGGARNYQQLEQESLAAMTSAGLRPEYFAICEATTLHQATPEDRELVLLAAAQLGSARLIDNLRLSLNKPQ